MHIHGLSKELECHNILDTIYGLESALSFHVNTKFKI
jgi:hypothetical protein